MSEFREFVDDYYRRFVEALATFDRAPLEEIVQVFERARVVGVIEVFERVLQGGVRLWVEGKGGSDAISDDLVCD